MNVKKILSLAVVLAMVLTVVPTFGLVASAADLEIGSTVMIDGIKYEVKSANMFPAFEEWTFGTGTGSWGNGSNDIPNHSTVGKNPPSSNPSGDQWGLKNDDTVGQYIEEPFGLSDNCGWNMKRAPMIFVGIDPSKTYYFTMKYKNKTTTNMYVRYGAINEATYTDAGGVDGKITFSGTGYRNNTESHTSGSTLPGCTTWTDETSIIKPGADADYFFFNDAWMDNNDVQVHDFAQMGLYEVAPVATNATITVKYTDNGKEIGTEEIPYYQGEKYTLSLGKYRLANDGSIYQLANSNENQREITVNDAAVEEEVKVLDKVKNVKGDNLVPGGEFNEKNGTLGHNLTYFKVTNENTLENINNTAWSSEDQAGLGYTRSFQTTVPVDAGKKYFYSIDIYSTKAAGLWSSFVFNKTTEPFKSGTLKYNEQVDASEGTQTNISANGTATGTQLTAGNENKWYTISGIVEATEADKMFEFDVYYMHDCPGSKIDNVKFYEVEDIPADVTVKFVDESGAAINIDPVVVDTFVGAKFVYDLPMTLVGKNKETYVRSAEQGNKAVVDFVKAGTTVNAVYKEDKIISADDPATVTTRESVIPALPATVKAKLESGETIDADVDWGKLTIDQFAKAGSVTVTGKVTDTVTVTATVTVETLDGYTVVNYAFDGNGTNAADNNKYNATYGTNITFVDEGIHGQAAKFAGTGSGFDNTKDMLINDDPLSDTRFASKAITISAFVNRTSSDWDRLFDFGTTDSKGNGEAGTLFYSAGNNSFKVEGSMTLDGNDGVPAIPANEWHHIAYTLEKTGDNSWTATAYQDGVQVGTETVTSETFADFTTLSAKEGISYYIGASHWNDPRFTGMIDDFKIYSVALTPAEVALEGTKYDVTVKYTLDGEEIASQKFNGFKGQEFALPATVNKEAIVYDVTDTTLTIDPAELTVDVPLTASTVGVKSVADTAVDVIFGKELKLPEKVKVTFDNETTADVAVTWGEYTIPTEDPHALTVIDVVGTIEGTDKTAQGKIYLYPADTKISGDQGSKAVFSFGTNYTGYAEVEFDIVFKKLINGTVTIGKVANGNGAFGGGGDAISIQTNGDGIRVRSWDPAGGKEDGKDGAETVKFEKIKPDATKAYHVKVTTDIKKMTYDVVITAVDGGDVLASATGVTYRDAVTEIDGLVAYDNNAGSADVFRTFNVQHRGINEAPAIEAKLGWDDAAKAFTIDYVPTAAITPIEGATYAVEVTASVDGITGGEYDPAKDAGVGIVPKDTNDVYSAISTVTVGDLVFKAATPVKAGIYGLVMDAIKASKITGTISNEQLTVVNDVLKNGNILLTNGELTDAAKQVMTISEDKNTITLTDQAFNLGLRFTQGIGSGEDATKDPTAATVNPDGKSITLPDAAAAEAMVLSLESVYLEFVPTEMADAADDDADAVQDFIPEL